MVCPHCGLDYQHLRTGLTFADVYALIYTRKHKRRHGVLGYWHETKMRMWQEHLDTCGTEPAPLESYQQIAGACVEW